MAKANAYPWEFRPRFRRHAFGWNSKRAIPRIKEAVSEIERVDRTDRLLAAEGAVLFLEKLSPALEHVDSPYGYVHAAAHAAVAALVEIIAAAPADGPTRKSWLERLFQAHAADPLAYIEPLVEYWGELCGSPQLASCWADRLAERTRKALRSDKQNPENHFHGTSACLCCFYVAGRYEELLGVLGDERFWYYRRWGAKALAALGRKAEAIRVAESSRCLMDDELDIDRLCEAILLSSGLADEAYVRYGLRANRARTYAAWFRAVARKYPHKRPREIFDDLVAETPGEEDRWFAAAKDAKLFDEESP